MKLSYSIVLVDNNQIDKGLKGLDDIAKSASNPGRSPI